jgi:pyrroline-5-carboxylate reductase
MNIGIIGYGSMGKMLLEKFIETETIEQSKIFISERSYDKIKDLNKCYPQINTCTKNTSVAQNADILFVCIRPLDIKTILAEVNSSIKKNCHIIVLNDSVLLKQVEQICGNKKISKIYPNVAGEVNRSVTLVCHNTYVDDVAKNNIKKLLECIGTVTELPESELGIGSDLASCMPGFIGAILKVMVEVAEKHTSIDKPQIIRMITETMYGTAKLLTEKEITFDNLISRVATKGGITEEGNKVIMAKLPAIIDELLEKTIEKRRILAKEVHNDFLNA